jgi:hypothetical protein
VEGLASTRTGDQGKGKVNAQMTANLTGRMISGLSGLPAARHRVPQRDHPAGHLGVVQGRIPINKINPKPSKKIRNKKNNNHFSGGCCFYG